VVDKPFEVQLLETLPGVGFCIRVPGEDSKKTATGA
jgi:hypothetical protein